MKFLLAYVATFSSATVIGVAEDVTTNVGALAVLSGVLIFVLKWFRDTQKEQLKTQRETVKALNDLKSEFAGLKSSCSLANKFSTATENEEGD